jgi:hypothetical protein
LGRITRWWEGHPRPLGKCTGAIRSGLPNFTVHDKLKRMEKIEREMKRLSAIIVVLSLLLIVAVLFLIILII